MSGHELSSGHDPVWKELADHFGLKSCRSFDISVRANGLAVIKAECNLTVEGAGKITRALKTYTFVEAPGTQERADDEK